MVKGIDKVRESSGSPKDAFFFNWALQRAAGIPAAVRPTHEAMARAAICTTTGQPSELAADLRRAFSGIVAGNVKEEGMRPIEQHGPFEIHGDADIMQALDALLHAFVEQQRMKLPGGTAYVPCYRIRTA